MVHSIPTYVRNPRFTYGDFVTPTYASFATANASRAARVYVGANDGFLHAFDGSDIPPAGGGTGGTEVWAYMPSFVMQDLTVLADRNYATRHQYFVDGTPEQADVFDSTAPAAWKTIVVAGTGAGNAGYFALDVTSPSAPKALWEFCSNPTLCANSDTDLGLAVGNPVIGKRPSDGKWVVVLTSGLNNTGGSNPGKGFFYVLDAVTGTVLSKVGTGAGSATTPSGLMKMAGLFETALTDATFKYVYAGDQLGNIWRLELGNPVAVAPAVQAPMATPGCTSLPGDPCVMHVATLKDSTGRAQPITTRPKLTHINTATVLFFATGRALGIADLTDPGAASGIAWQQTVYALKDKNSDYGTDIRTANLVTQTMTNINATQRTITNNPVDWNIKDGWMVDLNAGNTTPGERVDVDFPLVLGTLRVVSNIPVSSTAGVCDSRGNHFTYEFDYKSGTAISTSPGGVVGEQSEGTAEGQTLTQTADGVLHGDNQLEHGDENKPVNTNPPGGGLKRFSYRERS
jgi:type IV pilus assembly protein PilY1